MKLNVGSNEEVNLQTHAFVIPRKEITGPEEIASKWEKSEVLTLKD